MKPVHSILMASRQDLTKKGQVLLVIVADLPEPWPAMFPRSGAGRRRRMGCGKSHAASRENLLDVPNAESFDHQIHGSVAIDKAVKRHSLTFST